MRTPALILCALLLWPLTTLAQSDAPFLWQVRHGTTTHYLLGSVHMLPASAQPLPEALQDAYTTTEGILLETDLAALEDPQTQADLLVAAQAPKGLKALVGPALYQKLTVQLRALDIPLQTSCEPYKPWFCAMTLEALSFARAGFEPEYGIDQQLYNQAQTDDKTIGWLEEPQAHLALFTQMPDALSVEFLRNTLKELADDQQGPTALAQMWRSNDVRALERITLDMKRQQPRVYARLLANRTRAWLPQLTAAFEGDAPQLVIVGAAHLVGPDGLVALLKKAGYSVEPVPNTTNSPPAADPLPASAVR